MSSDSIRDRATKRPPFVDPFLHARDRRRERTALRPDELMRRARALLDERFGSSPQESKAAFAHAPLGLASEHTHYFAGFALFMPLSQGTAVAARPAQEDVSQAVVEGREGWSFDRSAGPEEAVGALPDWTCVVERSARSVRPSDGPVELAIVSTVRPSCHKAYLSALSVAALRVLGAFSEDVSERAALVQQATRILAGCTGRPFSVAYPMAADAGQPNAFALVDASAFEQLPVEAPAEEAPSWGLVDVDTVAPSSPDGYQQRKQQADEALALLQEHTPFEQLTSFRELEHRRLQQALRLLPSALQPVVRYLVTENRRVQKMVRVLRRGDGQLLGALLLMGHASLRDDGPDTSEAADRVVALVEQMSMEGMYGARQVDPGGCVVVVGQPFTVPRCLERITAAFEEHSGNTPDTALL